MKQLDALRIAKTRPWYTEDLYLTEWSERSGIRYCFLTPESVVGWGFTWQKAIADADKQYAKRTSTVNH